MSVKKVAGVDDPITYKAMAYITNRDRLLVFREPDFPEAGIQIPGGSIDPDESPDVAALREAFEETGLSGLQIGSYLGRVEHDLTRHGQVGWLYRHYFHLTIDGNLPETWQHTELFPSEGEHESVLFEFFWVDLPDGIPPMVGNRDEMIPELLRVLGYS
jgi:8-oxo-dGTP pyrophosphatase MutT (NUDIX family)